MEAFEVDNLDYWIKRGIEAVKEVDYYDKKIKEFNKDNSKFKEIPFVPTSVSRNYDEISLIIGRMILRRELEQTSKSNKSPEVKKDE